MAENERLKKVILWLQSQGFVEDQKDLAKQLKMSVGYLSHLATGEKPITEKFIKKISGKYRNINPDYILGVSEDMLIDEISENIQEVAILPRDRLDISDLIKAINNISEAALKNADSDRMRAEAELKRAEAEDRNSRNMEELIKLLKSDKQEEDKITAKKERVSERS